MDWIFNVVVNTLDIITIYCLYCGLTETKPAIFLRNILFGCIWGIIMATCVEYVGYDLYRLIAHTCYFILLYLMYKKKLHSTLLLLLTIYMLSFIAQAFVLLFIIQLPINDSIGELIGQFLSAVIIVVIYKKINISKFLKLIESTLPLKLIIYLCIAIIFTVFIFISFDYKRLTPTAFYFMLIMGISMFGFFHTLYKIFFYTNKLPVKYHEMQNALASICISSYYNKDRIYNEINSYLELLGLDFNMEDIDTSKEYQNILSLIEYKKKNNTLIKKVIFDIDIRFYESFEQVPESALMIILAILLDNSMEASPSGKNIKIFIHVAENLLTIEVANATKLKISELSKLFEKGQSTKNENRQLHGHGLTKLTEIVNKYKGKIFLESKYLKEEKSRYLFVRIEFKAWF